jgi:hypothetical protein
VKSKRKRSGRKYPRRKLWIERRDAAFARAASFCEITHERLTKRACDHLWPERWVRRWCPGADPHVLENLVVMTISLHAQKTAIEPLIFRGDMLGYRRELNRLGFPAGMLDNAMQAILASVKE